MLFRDSGFDQFNRERRKFAGRRLGSDRRTADDRRLEERRGQYVAVMADRRSGADRRVVGERRMGERRSLEDRRDSAWRMLEGQ